MMGIYKFQNKINGKVYIGQSISIENRYKQHKNNHKNKRINDYTTKFYRALRKYGFDNFTFEILEEYDSISKEELNKKEIYWIKYYNSYLKGYNSNSGGEKVTENCEKHPMAKLSNNQVLEIKRLLKNTKLTQYKIAEKYNIAQSVISQINNGLRWSPVGADIYSYPIRRDGFLRRGSKNPNAVLTDEMVMEARKRYVKESAPDIYKSYSNICSLKTLERVLSGMTYTYLPIYKKKLKKWIDPE